MIEKLPTFKQLLILLQQVPYLASKNLYRVATHFLDMDQQKFEQFCRILIEAKKNLEKCSICFAWKEKQHECLFCSDLKRNAAIICVVETWQDLLAIEKTSGYKGGYHVLGGSICPLEGVGPEHLSILPLVKRAQSGVQEVILALNQTSEGEATAAYIAQKLSSTSVKITCLAQGVPVGSSLEFMDRLTVFKALSDRRPF
jgi:recombination protein RecR